MARIANDPTEVASNKFFPFLRFEDTYRPYRLNGKPIKSREIRFGTRRDAAIFSRYRWHLSHLYEAEIGRLGISDCILAYRHIPIFPGSKSGKCNIHHASDAFDRIVGIGNCCAIVMDISRYFEHLDHSRIKRLWCSLLSTQNLPDDHYQVFKAITKYRVVDSKRAYEALGFFGVKPSGVPGYLKPKKKMPKQLCTPQVFREKICGKADGYDDLIEPNKNAYGVPQGAPLSDLLANLYLIDFDIEMRQRLSTMGGYYMRYSDDILFIVPSGADSALDLMEFVRTRIQDFGSKLRIKEEKCSVHQFTMSENGLVHAPVFPPHSKKNGLTYLGFRFDGRHVYLRDATLSALWRKISKMIAHDAIKLVQRFPGKDLSYLRNRFDANQIVQRVGRVRNFEPTLSRRSWTFWTYVTRATAIFGDRSRIHRQLANYRKKIRNKSNERLASTYYKSL